MPLPVVILATADFRSDVWTNKQHLAVRLAETRPVTYVESIGLRRPRLTRADLRRIARRVLAGRPVKEAAATPVPVPVSLDVVSPVVVPLHGTAAVQRLNHRLIARFVAPKLPHRYVLWTFSPLTYGLERRAEAVVYHSVDLIHHQPHFPVNAILSGERRMAAEADALVASSTGVRDHLVGLGATGTLLWENVADTALFGSTRDVRRRRAVFAGHLTPTKIDVAALRAVVEAGLDLVICGPVSRDGTGTDPELQALLDSPHTDYRGNLSPTELAQVFAQSEVGLIPYLLNDYTAGVFPLKVYEYLAAGLAVVSTPLPSLGSVPADVVHRADTAAFARAVATELDGFSETGADDRRRIAAGHSWEARTRQAEALIAALAPA